MKYLLVDNSKDIVSTVELASDVGLTGAKTYFLGVKKLEEKEFNKLWKVYTKTEWDNIQHAYRRPPSSDPNRAWWKEEQEILKDEWDKY